MIWQVVPQYVPMAGESTAMTSLGTVVTQMFTWVGNVVSTISGEPLLLLAVGIFCAGAAIGLAHRLIGR
ncbi:MAG: hypothetical protein K2I93_02785 [Oscillospiraceae bacterium]|nr:hypothetical protein [Oscillospiraceae bacterium]